MDAPCCYGNTNRPVFYDGGTGEQAQAIQG